MKKIIFNGNDLRKEFVDYERDYFSADGYDALLNFYDENGTQLKKWYEAKELIEKHDIDVAKSLLIGNDSTTDIKGAKECRMDAFYVKSNISPKDDMAHDADYVIDNFTNW